MSFLELIRSIYKCLFFYNIMEKEYKFKNKKIDVDVELIKILDGLKKDLEHYLWDKAKISYRELTAILAEKINSKQIKI